MVRARLDESGKVRLEALQEWINSLQQQQGKSRFVSDDLAVALTGLRVLLGTPAGALDVSGDVKLVKNLPVSASLRARPARIVYQGAAIDLRAASFDYTNAGRLTLRLSGSARKDALELRDADVSLDATGLKWSMDKQLSLSVSQARLQFSAAALTAGSAFTAPKLDMALRDIAASTGQGLQLRGEVTATASSGMKPVIPPALAYDKVMANALAANLAQVSVSFGGRFEQRGNRTSFSLTAPLEARGAKGALLRVSALKLAGSPGTVNGALQASLSGAGLPAANLALNNLAWSGGGLTGDAVLSARFNYAMMRGANIATQGVISWKDSRYTFQPSQCARATLTAFHPAASDLARDVRANICATAGQPLLSGEGAAWTFIGDARGASAFLPLGNAQVDQAAGHLAFQGVGSDFHGTATVSGGANFRSPQTDPLQADAGPRLGGSTGGGLARPLQHDGRREGVAGRRDVQSRSGQQQRYRAYRRAEAHLRAGQVAAGRPFAAPGGVPARRRHRQFYRRHRLDQERDQKPRRALHRQPEFPHPAGQGDGGEDKACLHLAPAAHHRRQPDCYHLPHRLDLAVHQRGPAFRLQPNDREGECAEQRLGRGPGGAGRLHHQFGQPQAGDRHGETRIPSRWVRWLPLPTWASG